MPTVRRAERQVGVEALRGGTRSAAATPDSEGAGLQRAKADTLLAGANFGERTARYGADLFARIKEQERTSADQTALLEANNQLSAWKNQQLYDPNNGALTKKGKDALPIPEQLREEFDKAAGAIEAGLSSDSQRAAFSRLRSQEWQGIDLQARRHVLGEMQQYQAGELKGLVDNATDAAIKNALDPRMVNLELSKAISALKTTGPGLGLGPEQIDAQVSAVRTKTHVGVISSLLAQEKDGAASAYYEAVKDQIGGEQQDAIVKALEEGSLRGESQRKADAILLAGGTRKEQREKARAIEDPKLRDQVEQRIEHAGAIAEREEREAEQATMREGYDILDQTGDVTKIPPALWTTFDGSTRSAMISYARAKAKGEPVVTDLPTYYELMLQAGEDPTAFADRNLLAFRNKLDEVEFKQLAGLQLSLKVGDKKTAEKELGGFQTRSELLDDSLTAYGIDPKAKYDTKDGKALAQLRRMLDRRVELLQAGGKKATNQDIQDTIDSILSQSEKTPGSWWQIRKGEETKTRLIDTTVDQIPAAFKRRNPGVSDAVLLDRWNEAKYRVFTKTAVAPPFPANR